MSFQFLTLRCIGIGANLIKKRYLRKDFALFFKAAFIFFNL